MSVNLSARQFAPARPRRRRRRDPRRDRPRRPRLELEITESVADGPVRGRHPDAPPAARPGRPARARRLRHRLLVAVVPQAPAARHDQDRPLVRRRASTETADRSIVEAVIALAHGLGIGVVAEGIETEAPGRAACASSAATSGQGYLFAGRCPEPTRATAVTGRGRVDAGRAAAGGRATGPAHGRPRAGARTRAASSRRRQRRDLSSRGRRRGAA